MPDDVKFTMIIDAAAIAEANPDTTLLFVAGAGKLLVECEDVDGYPCLGITAQDHNESLGTLVEREKVPTALLQFRTKESVDLIMGLLEKIRQELVDR